MSGKYDSLVERFLLAEPIHRVAARMILMALQEDAIEPLADAYFAGVNDEQGIAILDLMADIGGYEALNVPCATSSNMRPNVVNYVLLPLMDSCVMKTTSAKKKSKSSNAFLDKYASEND